MRRTKFGLVRTNSLVDNLQQDLVKDRRTICYILEFTLKHCLTNNINVIQFSSKDQGQNIMIGLT